jgi:hypothetical protein
VPQIQKTPQYLKTRQNFLNFDTHIAKIDFLAFSRDLRGGSLRGGSFKGGSLRECASNLKTL